MEFFICNLVRVVQSPRFYMSLFFDPSLHEFRKFPCFQWYL